MANAILTEVGNAFATAGEDVVAGVVAGAAVVIGAVPGEELGALVDAVKAFEKELAGGATWGAALASALTVLYNDEKLIVSQTTVKLLDVFVSSAQGAGATAPGQ